MNSLLYYYNNVQKMAAYRQAKRMQRGVKLGENQSVGGSTTAKFVSNPIPIGTDDFTVEFYGSMCGSNVSYASLFNAASPSAGGDRTFSFYSRYYPNNGIYGILFSPDTDGDSLGDQVVVQYEPGDDSKFLVSVTRQGTTVKVYINGELKTTKEQSAVKDLGDMQLAIANSSDVGFVRVWNYALSADEIATLYNNGDPMGYVVPKAKRGGLLAEYLPQNLMESRKGPEVEPKAKIYEFNIGDEYYKPVLTQAKYPYDCIYRVDYVVDEWDYQPKPIGSVGFLGLIGATILTPDGQDWSTLEKAKVGESRTLLVKMPGTGSPAFYIYGGNDFDGATARHLKVTIKGITSVSVPISWLDSAKQLPLSDEYMEPLFQSIGGYDMTANGVPEILYNE